MNKQIAKIISVLELIVAVVMYFAVAYQFDNDPIIMKILPYTDFEATLLRLSIYIIPGINIIAGFFGITFNTKGILCFAGVLELLAAYLTLYFKGKSDLMNFMGIAMIVMGVLFIICVLTLKDPKKVKKEKPKKK
ncbi:MAG: hypothetical protein IIY30_00785 [Erysipelotrichaceae bacterium]|jgi:hypothetical protein|nr:hypothetical protein [Erysipelotrichaceae bacterium]MBQ1322301.1 hypothetical protein [Erysipelotrichaceae bacterium]MBQ1347115.1 hypothetical protein [Erysipelotrichaceae bacterium]MBQ1740935.1 hypothetical protein [Erysipelotrichaceae bacterium]MBQ1776341.1 hypothetical protein [Erysipelotrichaceae bacterium]